VVGVLTAVILVLANLQTMTDPVIFIPHAFYVIFMPHASVNVLQQGLREYSALMATLLEDDQMRQMGRCLESLRLTMVRATRFYTLVPKFLADPPTHSATIR